eukprot:4272445-Prymnesium_polylepis.1
MKIFPSSEPIARSARASIPSCGAAGCTVRCAVESARLCSLQPTSHSAPIAFIASGASADDITKRE